MKIMTNQLYLGRKGFTTFQRLLRLGTLFDPLPNEYSQSRAYFRPAFVSALLIGLKYTFFFISDGLFSSPFPL
jgi:hypothetical protein